MSDIKIFACDDSACIFQVNDAALDPRPFYVLSEDYSALKEDREAVIVREAALREELESIKASVDGYDSPEHAAQVADEMGYQCIALQQRLTVAEQRAGDLESVLINVRETLGREYWDQYAGLDETRDILDAALKPAAEGEGS